MGSSRLLPKYKENLGNSSISIARHHYSFFLKTNISFVSTSRCLAIYFILYVFIKSPEFMFGVTNL